jgi:uncharacterized protein
MAPESAPTLILLTPAERRVLLMLARESLEMALQGLDVPRLAEPTVALLEYTGAFVSLHQGERLRGCVGTIAAERPLYVAVARMARAAAFDDPRFPPLTAIELSDVTIEVSRLSPTMPARPEDVQPGHHGVCVQHGVHRAVFLPQVATHYGWNRETLLNELCGKALLPEDAWRQAETCITVFVAERFSEADTEGA